MDDYYATLCVSPSASYDEIKMAYRKLAMKCHPDKNLGEEAAERFMKLAEAFEVLSDSKKRHLFDQYRGDGLLVPRAQEGAVVRFHGEPRVTFAQLFGSNDPFGIFVADGLIYRTMQTRPREHDLQVTLYDVDNGCRKKMETTRISMSTGMPHRENVQRYINVKPGVASGYKIRIRGAGDHTPGRAATDVVFVVRVWPHAVFKRDGVDLKYTAEISLKQALSGGDLEVPTLKGETVTIETKGEVIQPDTVKRIAGQGLPYYREPTRRGDLVVNFKITFPESLPESTRETLKEIMIE